MVVGSSPTVGDFYSFFSLIKCLALEKRLCQHQHQHQHQRQQKKRVILFTNSHVVETKKNNATYYTLTLRPHVRWTEDTVDNENLNRKRSKSNVI